MKKKDLPVAIIGGGPIGLAAAAHLAKREIPFLLFESGKSVGSNFLSWGHVRVFSPWEYNLDKAAESLLLASGWEAPDKKELPTGNELVQQYFRPLAELDVIAPHIRLDAKVISVGRKGVDKTKTWGREQHPFVLGVKQTGVLYQVEASAVIDASGTWNQPNPIGSGGVKAEGEETYRSNIFYGIPDVKGNQLDRYKNKHVAVVGSGHSAINVLLDLADVQEGYPHTKLTWILRKKDVAQVYGGQGADELEARGTLGIRIEQLVNSGKVDVHTPFQINRLKEVDGQLNIAGAKKGEEVVIEGIDEIISNTGARPNLEMLKEVRIDTDAALEAVFDLAEMIDPNLHSCGTVPPHGEAELRHPEKDFYIVGSKSYGRAPTFLMATGYEQVRSVVAHLAGDEEGAKNIELHLPQTGVCSAHLHVEESGACCA